MLTALSDEVAPGLPAPWPATARSAARSQVDAIPSALGRAIADALPAQNSAALWWRLVAVWQGLLLGGAVAGLAWLVVLIVAGIFGALQHTTFSNVALLPWIAVMIATNEIESRHRVDLDTTIKTLADTGRDMSTKYKETSEAGLAQNLTLC